MLSSSSERWLAATVALAMAWGRERRDPFACVGANQAGFLVEARTAIDRRGFVSSLPSRSTPFGGA